MWRPAVGPGLPKAGDFLSVTGTSTFIPGFSLRESHNTLITRDIKKDGLLLVR